MTVRLPQAFLGAPLAHRAFHDGSAGRPENSRAAIRAAMDAGYGIEIDVQLTADGQAVVFHDYALGRLTGETGPLRQRTAADLAQIALTGGDETIPSLAQVRDLVAGRVPLLVEVKDQDGALGPAVGPLEDAVLATMQGYAGPLALMSFNPHSVRHLSARTDAIATGLVTCSYPEKDWPLVPAAIRNRLREIADFDSAGATFISHEAADLGRPRVAALKAQVVPVLCWTVRSAEVEAQARKVADNITFEGYAAALPGA